MGEKTAGLSGGQLSRLSDPVPDIRAVNIRSLFEEPAYFRGSKPVQDL